VIDVTAIDFRYAFYVVWGIVTPLVYWVVMDGHYRDYILNRDRRARRELLQSIGLFLTAVLSTLAIAGSVLFGPAGSNIRALLAALALGAFTGVGFVMLGDRRQRRKGDRA